MRVTFAGSWGKLFLLNEFEMAAIGGSMFTVHINGMGHCCANRMAETLINFNPQFITP
jgi:hypothetical protein